jgi:hypothetical protein
MSNTSMQMIQRGLPWFRASKSSGVDEHVEARHRFTRKLACRRGEGSPGRQNAAAAIPHRIGGSHFVLRTCLLREEECVASCMVVGWVVKQEARPPRRGHGAARDSGHAARRRKRAVCAGCVIVLRWRAPCWRSRALQSSRVRLRSQRCSELLHRTTTIPTLRTARSAAWPRRSGQQRRRPSPARPPARPRRHRRSCAAATRPRP